MDSDTLAYPGLKEIVIASKIKARNIHTSNWRIIYLAGRLLVYSVRAGGGIWATDYLIFLESPNYSRLDAWLSKQKTFHSKNRIYYTYGKILLPRCGFLEFKYFMA